MYWWTHSLAHMRIAPSHTLTHRGRAWVLRIRPSVMDYLCVCAILQLFGWTIDVCTRIRSLRANSRRRRHSEFVGRLNDDWLKFRLSAFGQFIQQNEISYTGRHAHTCTHTTVAQRLQNLHTGVIHLNLVQFHFSFVCDPFFFRRLHVQIHLWTGAVVFPPFFSRRAIFITCHWLHSRWIRMPFT